MKIRLHHILCAVDFSSFSPHVLHCGVGLARRFGARLSVFHAVPSTREASFGTPAVEPAETEESLTREALMKMGKLMRPFSVEWKPAVGSGDPVEALAGVVQKEAVDMVVAASHGLSGWKRLVLGAVVEKLARTVPLPLLVIRLPKGRSRAQPPAAAWKCKRVVVGCDLCHEAVLPIRYGAGLAEAFSAELHLLHAMPAPLDEEPDDLHQGPYGERQRAQMDALRRRMEASAPPEIRDRGRLRTISVPGVPSEELCRYAAEQKGDLLVVGVRYHSALEKLLMGSATERTLRHAPCPVLTVPSVMLEGERRRAP